MRRVEDVGMDGKPISWMIPETDEDLRELERLAQEGKADLRQSFGDDPDVWEKPRRRKRRR